MVEFVKYLTKILNFLLTGCDGLIRFYNKPFPINVPMNVYLNEKWVFSMKAVMFLF